MKTRFTRLIPALLAAAVLVACDSAPTTTNQGNVSGLTLPSASPSPTATPAPVLSVKNLLVWEVKPAGQSAPVSYLVGAMSTNLDPAYQLPAAFTAKFSGLQAYYGEANLVTTEAEDKNNVRYIAAADQNLEQQLGSADWAKLQQWLKDYGQPIPDQNLRLFYPWFASQAIAAGVRDRLAGKTSLSSTTDGQLQSKAKAAGLPIRYLETTTDQIVASSSLSKAEQLRLLKLSLSQGPAKLTTDLTELFRLYNAGDLSGLDKLDSAARAESTESYQKVIVERNQRWLQTLTQAFKAQPVVVVVGVGNTLGSEGLVQQLQKQSFELKTLSFN